MSNKITTGELLRECQETRQAYSEEALDQDMAWFPIHVDRLAALVRCAVALECDNPTLVGESCVERGDSFQCEPCKALYDLSAAGIEVSDE